MIFSLWFPPSRTVLFEKKKNGITYRVPALLYIQRWTTMLAFAEERLSADDAHANLLVLRRGIFYRNYVEWEDMHAVERAHLPGHRSMNPCPVYDEFTGELFLFFISVLGRTTESYQIITGRNLARLCYVRSLDQGKTWSEVVDLTNLVIGESLKGWATFALGPGHGIQLKSGRLLIPAYTYKIDCKDCFGKLCRTTPRAFAFHSDDHGQTWVLGELIPNLQSVECQLVSVDEEDGNNILYCNARSSLGFRVQSVSNDGGIIFQPGQLIEKLVETPNGCHGSVIGFPAPLHSLSSICANNQLPGQHRDHKFISQMSGMLKHPKRKLNVQQQHHQSKDPLYQQQSQRGTIIRNWTLNKQIMSVKKGSGHLLDLCELSSPAEFEDLQTYQETPYRTDLTLQTPTWVLYSHPTSQRSRVNLGVYLSTYPRDADSWKGPWVIYEGPSAYSDLAYIELTFGEDGELGSPPPVAFACLYENGLNSPYEEISFSIFTLYEVIQNLPFSSTQLYQEESKDRMKENCSAS
ncbi:sialidase-4 [Rhinophrynus dorsalis]